MSEERAGNVRLFWAVALVVVVLDVVTKYLAVKHLVMHIPREVFGQFLRFTLAYNQGAAFSMRLGSPSVSRIVFGLFAMIALFVLWRIHRTSRADDHLRTIAVALAWGGAAGNLIDRIRSTQGVVDFIDVGINSTRFWTFNVADSAVSVGAVMLAIMLWREDMEAKRASEMPVDASAAPAAPAETARIADDTLPPDPIPTATPPDSANDDSTR